MELPSQFIKLSVTINDSSVDFNPNNIPGRVIIVLDSLKVCNILYIFFHREISVINIFFLLFIGIKQYNIWITNVCCKINRPKFGFDACWR